MTGQRGQLSERAYRLLARLSLIRGNQPGEKYSITVLRITAIEFIIKGLWIDKRLFTFCVHVQSYMVVTINCYDYYSIEYINLTTTSTVIQKGINIFKDSSKQPIPF